jgi:hypothetical protein
MPAIDAFSTQYALGGYAFPANTSKDLYGFAYGHDPDPDALASPALEGMGVPVSDFPVSSPAAREVDAYVGNSYLNDYYFRIHINPQAVDVGNLLTRKEVNIYVWNSYFEPVTLDNVASFNAGGLNLIPPAPLPMTFFGNTEKTFILEASTSGSPLIDASFDFVFDSARITMDVTGRRLILFAFPPNWGQGMTEKLEWKTDILRSFSGSEQRRILRRNPRRSFTYTLRVWRDEAQAFDNILWGWQKKYYGLPVWTDKARLTATATSGDAAIAFPTANLSFALDGLGVIFDDFNNYEVFEI